MSPLENCPHDIVYVSDEAPGFKRKTNGKGFIYIRDDGKQVKAPNLLKRFEALVIPPMWKDVWICKEEKGHLQATGYDAKERKQYLYHPLWTDFRQQTKYSKLAEFGHCLPLIRKTVKEDIQLKKWPKRKILALLVSLLDEHYIRIGNEFYKKQNQTYGLTTLRRKHLESHGQTLELSYKAKSGKYRKIPIKNKKLAKLIKKSSELPGYEIFRYLDEQGKSHRLDSSDVNQYLFELTGSHFTAKDFRTWGGTVLAIGSYKKALCEVEQNPRLNLETTIVKKVAEVLGNTIATCREYYIHPAVLSCLVQGNCEQFKSKETSKIKYKRLLSQDDLLALKIIEHS